MTTARRDLQLALFPSGDLPLVRAERVSPGRRLAPATVGADEPVQPGLFDATNLLRSTLERCITNADFADAARLRDAIVAGHGASLLPADLDFLDELAPCDWTEGSLDALLQAWGRARGAIATPARRRHVAHAFLTRLASREAPDDIAKRDPDSVADLANALGARGEHELARSVLREALLRGREVAPDDIDDDDAADLLREPWPARWLASLGALRGTFTVPRPSGEERARIEASLLAAIPDASDDDARAAAFWDCLRIAALGMRDAPEALRAARMRMRALHPELHALLLGR